MANIKNKKDMTKCNIKILMATSVLCVFFNGAAIYGAETGSGPFREDQNNNMENQEIKINKENEDFFEKGNLKQSEYLKINNFNNFEYVDLKNKRKIICNCIPYTNPKGNISICFCCNYCNDPDWVDWADWADWEEEEDDDSFLNKENEKYEYIRNLYPKGFQNEYGYNEFLMSLSSYDTPGIEQQKSIKLKKTNSFEKLDENNIE